MTTTRSGGGRRAAGGGIEKAVHGTMAGYTGFTVGLVNNHTVLIPIPALAAMSPRSMNCRGRTWERVLSITHQPNTVPPKRTA